MILKKFPDPTVTQIDLWYKRIGAREYKITASETTSALQSTNRTFYTCSFYMDEDYRHDRVVYEKLSRGEIEKLFEATIQKLTLDNSALSQDRIKVS
jgi:hypothetical protein